MVKFLLSAVFVGAIVYTLIYFLVSILMIANIWMYVFIGVMLLITLILSNLEGKVERFIETNSKNSAVDPEELSDYCMVVGYLMVGASHTSKIGGVTVTTKRVKENLEDTSGDLLISNGVHQYRTRFEYFYERELYTVVQLSSDLEDVSNHLVRGIELVKDIAHG